MLALKLRQSSCFSLSNTDNGHQNHHQILLLAAEWLSSPRTGSRKVCVGGGGPARGSPTGFSSPISGPPFPRYQDLFFTSGGWAAHPCAPDLASWCHSWRLGSISSNCRLGATTPLLSLSQTSQEAFRKSFYSCPSSLGHLLGDP